ncbi:SGNH/GDSL hydrolase family protein [Amycolatopsis plumensis]|uniref:SGNH/GDSL hydrolase family protein n=1 Tax=Amycolatopsis plumensis TaxID=236508 RepID=A0ABV5U8I6_9PSEU
MTRPATPGAWPAALAAGSPTIHLLGDSLFEGGAVDPPLRWHQMLGDSFRSDGAPGTQVWIGGAIPGSATADYLPGARYAGHVEFTVHHPSLILLGWGINDWAAGIPPALFASQYQQIIDRIRALSEGSTLAFIHTPWVYNPDLTATRGPQAPYRDAIQALAAANGAGYLGLEWYFPGDDRYQQATPDRVHLNAAGQNTMYTAVRAFLLGMCGAA